VKNYPNPDDLSKTRLTKLVYLADWMSANLHGRQLTKIRWYFDHYGPYVPDVYEAVVSDHALRIQKTISPFGNPKEVIAMNHARLNPPIHLALEDQKILDEVIEKTQNLSWNRFIEYVYSTYPVESQERYSYLDLVNLSKEFKALPK